MPMELNGKKLVAFANTGFAIYHHMAVYLDIGTNSHFFANHAKRTDGNALVNFRALVNKRGGMNIWTSGHRLCIKIDSDHGADISLCHHIFFDKSLTPETPDCATVTNFFDVIAHLISLARRVF